MKSAEVGGNVAPGCATVCGMCPSCVLGPKPPGSSRSPWRASDHFRRRFVVELLSRCRSARVLRSIRSWTLQDALSWMVHTEARSRRPLLPEDYPSRASRPPPRGKPLGVDKNEIWKWFDSSPPWTQADYLYRVLCLCDPELLRMVHNLSSVLLVRHNHGFLQFDVSGHDTNQHDQDSVDPALMVVPGSSQSMSGVSLYRDFIGCLPVDLSKRILGLLEEDTLQRCKKVCRYWQRLAQETLHLKKFMRIYRDEMEATEKRYSVKLLLPTYANLVEVPVPMKDDEEDVRPFQAAYVNIKTKAVQMEERNVYCGAHYTKVLLGKKDPHRVLDYRGGPLMATGSKDCLVHLFYVASETRNVAVMKGHVGSIRTVLLCEDRDLVITAGRDPHIRCWNLKTDRCEMMLSGHTGAINCLDVHADRLASGDKDGKVKVWSLHTGRQFEGFNFKHRSSVRCVKMDRTTVYSSCDRGLVKVWSMESASLLRVIDGHSSSVKCLFFDEWHLLSGDTNGKVMAWSTNCDADACLMTFNHPMEVLSLTLAYLRVITGCVDGKIRIFDFLTGDCLKGITAEAEAGSMLSLHFHDQSILVNTTSSVKLYQFAKVFWEYPDSTQGAQGDVVSEKSAALLGKCPSSSAGVSDVAQRPSPTQRFPDCNKPERAKLLYQTRLPSTPTKCPTQLMLSEKAACERMKKKGLHHPLTRDSILLKINAIQKAHCTDEASINMESNARLRDSWGPRTPQDPPHSAFHVGKQSLATQLSPLQRSRDGHPRRAETCIPTVRRAVSQNTTNKSRSRDVSAVPDTHRQIKSAGLPNPERRMKTSTGLPRINPFREQEEGFRRLTVTQR